MKRIILISLLSLGIILTGCEKDKYKSTRISHISVGNNHNMIVNIYNTTLSPLEFLSIDLDNNGVYDVQFEIVVIHLNAWNYHHKTLIKSLSSNLEIQGFYVNDTVFNNTNTVIDSTGTPIRVHKYTNYTCERMSENDSIHSVSSVFILNALNEGEVIEIDNSFASSTLRVFESPNLGTPYSSGVNNDTLVLLHTSYYNNCTNFPLESVKYIGVKFVKESRLGWIKVILPEEDRITIVESGIQK